MRQAPGSWGRVMLCGALTLAAIFVALASLPNAGAREPANKAVVASASPANDPALADHMRQFALNALLVPLLDGTEHPPRWHDVETTMPCQMAPSATVNGGPVVPHEEVLSPFFTVRWQLDHCMPFGLDGPQLTGLAELDVFGDDEGLSARVRLVGFRIDQGGHVARLDEVFAARTP